MNEEFNERPPDPKQELARKDLTVFFAEHKDQVFYSRQIEILYEREYFHWITNRALRELEEGGLINSETRSLETGGSVKLYWHRLNRYYKRGAKKVVGLIEEYSDSAFTEALGRHGESMVESGFARNQFVILRTHTNEFKDRRWTRTEHNLDYILTRDSVVYGIEVKNTLGYMPKDELDIKIELCKLLEIKPVFVVRMLPASWTYRLWQEGGFALIIKHQLYPWGYKKFAERISKELGLPVDCPGALYDGTVQRFINNFHQKFVN